MFSLGTLVSSITIVVRPRERRATPLGPRIKFPGGGGGGGGGGHSGTEGGRTFVTYFAEEGVFFKTSACPRFCKRRVLFCT